MLFLLFACVFSFDVTVREFLEQHGLSVSEFADRLRKSDIAQIVHPFQDVNSTKYTPNDGVPLAFAHGMGDSCFNPGMKQITQLGGQHLGVYSVCLPTGKSQSADTMNGFFMTMDKNVDIWAEKVRADPNLKDGFHAVGFSQGNSVIRGYIHKYNDPPVKTWLSVHGTVMGVAGFPNCNPDGLLGPVCKLLAEFLGELAYAEFVQNMLFQADYFRDPKRYTDKSYIQNSEIAQWNQENPNNQNFTYKQNFVKVKQFAMIKAEKDTMVFPNEAEWWGQFEEGSLKNVLKMKDTPLYKNDAFGLKTVDDAGKLVFNTTSGNHLKFSEEQLYWWLDNYLVA